MENHIPMSMAFISTAFEFLLPGFTVLHMSRDLR